MCSFRLRTARRAFEKSNIFVRFVSDCSNLTLWALLATTLRDIYVLRAINLQTNLRVSIHICDSARRALN